MKYNKYGETIDNSLPTASKNAKKAMVIIILVQVALIAVNIAALFMPGIGMYLALITVPLYALIYLNFKKSYNDAKSGFLVPVYCKVTSWLSPVLYVITVLLAVLTGF